MSEIGDRVKINTDMYAVYHNCPNCGVGMFHTTEFADKVIGYSCPSCDMPMSLNYKEVKTIGEWLNQ